MRQGLERLFWVVGGLLLLPFIIQQSLVLGHNASSSNAQVPQLRSFPQARAAVINTASPVHHSPVYPSHIYKGTLHTGATRDRGPDRHVPANGRDAVLNTPEQSNSPDTSAWSAGRIAAWSGLIHLAEKPVGVLSIPSLEVEVPVFPSTDEIALTLGAGVIAGTAQLTDNHGNIGVASHRDGHFRHLKHVSVGDLLLLRTAQGIRHYQITSTRIVDPGDTWVLDPTEVPSMTLVTCYPFQFVGRAPQRYIVSAQEVPSELTAVRLTKPVIGGHHETIKF